MSRHIARLENKAYIFNLVRAFDNENYVINLFERDPHARLGHAVLRGLNVELDRIKATVSNEDIARIRIQYFRDGLNAILSSRNLWSASQGDSGGMAGQVESMPIFDCLKETLTTYPNVDFGKPLHGLINAREEYLKYPEFNDIDQLQTFVANVHRPLLGLHGSIHDVEYGGVLIDKAAKAIGIAIILRAVPMHAQARVSYMPRVDERGELSTKHLLSYNEESSEVFKLVANTARANVADVREAMNALDRRDRKPLWPVLLADMYLTRLSRRDDNPFDEQLMRSVQTTWHLNVQLRMLRARWLGY